MRFTLAALLISSASLCAAPTLAQTRMEILEGHLYSYQVCGQCHAVEKNDYVSPNPASPPFDSIMSQRETTDMALLIWLHSPHESMPNIHVESQDLQNLVAYMSTLRPDYQAGETD